MSIYKTVVTAAGEELLAACVLKGEKLTIAQAAVGDGGGSSYTPTEAQTALKNEVWRGDEIIVSINEANPKMMDVRVTVSTEQDIVIREAGLFADDGTLVAVCSLPSIQMVDPDTGASQSATLMIHLLHSNTDAINISVDTASCVVSHRWSGTTLVVTSASGTSSADLQGPQGATGATGAAGVDGENGEDGGYYTPSVSSGKMSFTPSKSSMPAVSDVTLKDQISPSDIGAADDDHKHSGGHITPTSIELVPGSSAGHGGYIDFHYNGASAAGEDYTSRIWENREGEINVAADKLKVGDIAVLLASKVIAVYNTAVSFVAGKATYTNAAITAASMCLVQRRAGQAGYNLAFSTTSYDGYVNIFTDADQGTTDSPETMNLNILVINS